MSIAGDDEQIDVNDREWMRQVWEAPTAADLLRAYAIAARSINERAGDIFAVVTAAAALSPAGTPTTISGGWPTP